MNIKTGISDNTFTEIVGGDIKEGDKLVTRENAVKDDKASTFSLRADVMATDAPLIRVEGLTKHYESVAPDTPPALHDVTLAISLANSSPSWGRPAPANRPS